MGCDIHVIGQTYYFGSWDTFQIPNQFTNRNYNVFGMLADVRNNHTVPVIKQPTGYPIDFTIDSNNTFHEVLIFHGHSESFLTLKELKTYRKTFNRKKKISAEVLFLIDYLDNLISFLEYWKHDKEDDTMVRIVFNFDS